MSRSDVRRALGLLIALCTFATAIGCSSSTDESSGATTTAEEAPPTRGGRLVFGVTAEANGWNPASDQWTVDSHLVASTFYESLAAVGQNYAIVPQLAESITPNADFTEWTIRTREGVRFHDGTPCDAAAVKANLDAQLNGIGSLGLKPIKSVMATDPRTVTVSMSTPWSSFPGILAGSPGYIASPASLADGTASTHPVGTGPYVFKEWTPDRNLLVTRNEDYWQPELPYLDDIEFQTIVDSTSRGAALRSGAIDMMLTIEARDALSYREDPDFKVITDDNAEETHVSLNFARPPFDNELARRAIIHATDQNAVIQALGPDLMRPADGPFGPGEPSYPDDSHYAGYDPEAAAQEVSAYQQQTGQQLSFTLMTFSDDVSVQQAQLLHEMWTKAGAQVRLESLEQSAFISRIIVGDFQAATSSNFGYADPDFNWTFWHSSQSAPLGQLSTNFLHLSDPTIDRAMEQARATSDPDTRASAYQTVMQQLNDDYGYVWLYRTPYTIVARSNVGGLNILGDAGFARADSKPWMSRLYLS